MKLFTTGSGFVTETPAIEGIASLDGFSVINMVQMSNGIRRLGLESDIDIKGVASTRGRVPLPMCALNSIGKFADRRLTLLWIGPRIVPKLRALASRRRLDHPPKFDMNRSRWKSGFDDL